MCPPDMLGSLVVARRLDVMLDHLQRTPLPNQQTPQTIPPVTGQSNTSDTRTSTQQESPNGNNNSPNNKENTRVNGNIGGQTAQHVNAKNTDSQNQHHGEQPSGERHTVRIGDLAISVSRGGKALATVLQTFPDFIVQKHNSTPSLNQAQPHTISRNMLLGKAPVLTATQFNTEGKLNIPAVAAGLRDTVNSSGLFYESHLAQWSMGARDLSDILREPQAMLSRPDVASMAENARQKPLPEHAEQIFNRLLEEHSSSNASTKSSPIQNQNIQSPSSFSGHPRLDQQLRTYQAFDLGEKIPSYPPPPEFFDEISVASTQKSLRQMNAAVALQNFTKPILQSGVATETTPLLQKQLECLEQPHFAWAGEAWPGVAMEWDVEPSEGKNKTKNTQQAWHSQLRLALPTLGGVEIKLNLLNQTLVMQVKTTNPDTSQTLRDTSHELRSQLLKAGLQVLGLTVQTDSPPPTAEPQDTSHDASSQ